MAEGQSTSGADAVAGQADGGNIDIDQFELLLRAESERLDPDTSLDGVSLVFLLARLSGQLLGELDAIHRPRGWSWSGFRIMFAVLVAGPLEPRQIAPLAGVTRASISAVLNTLERDGLVERRRDSQDRRVVTIVLTEEGRAQVLDVHRAQRAVENEWAETLSPAERTQFLSLMRKLLAARS